MRHTAAAKGIQKVLSVLLCLFLCAGCALNPPVPSETGTLPAASSEETAAVPASSEAETAESSLSGMDVTHIHSFTRRGPVTPPTCTEAGSEVWFCACGESRVDPLPPAHTPGEPQDIPAQVGVPGWKGRVRCTVCGAVLEAGTEIPAISPEEVARTVTVRTDDVIRVLAEDLTETKTLYTTDGNGSYTAENGQVDFWLAPLASYLVAGVTVEGQYDALEELGGGRYRITGIGSDLTVTAWGRVIPIPYTSDELLAHIGSDTDEDGLITFWWDLNEDVSLSSMEVRISCGETSESESVFLPRGEWQYRMPENERVTFLFVPYGEERRGSGVEVSRMYRPSARSIAIPRVEIETESGFFPYADYIYAPSGCLGRSIENAQLLDCLVRIYDESGAAVYDSGEDRTLEDRYRGATVKLRGNTSAYEEKAPYRIRLEERADLLADLIPGRRESGICYENRSWVLLASGFFMDQAVGSAVASVTGVPCICAYRYVSLYFNGDFRGIYVLVESVGQGSGTGETQSRVPVSDSGFIAEADAYWWKEPYSFTTACLRSRTMRYSVKYPDMDDLSEDDPTVVYLRNWLSEMDAAIADGSGRYTEYLDVGSFAAWLLAHDYIGTADGAGTNLYLFKRDDTPDTKVEMGPLWDFDTACIIVNGWSVIHYASFFSFSKLTSQPAFAEAYRALYLETCGRVWETVKAELERIDGAAYTEMMILEGARWGRKIHTYEDQMAMYESFFARHLAWMSGELGG